MLFNSWEFLVFFAGIFGLYCTLAVRAQNVLLLLASYVFYGWWDWRFLFLMLLSTVVDYTVGRMMDGADDAKRKRLVWLSVGTNLTILGFFKYFNFFIDSTASALAAVGFEANLPTLSIILPVGISFYTFQTMAYTIDVYRKKMEPVRDPLLFAVYVSYFPQLVAGPIERAQNLMPQFAQKRTITSEKLASGALLVLIGLARKVLIADVVASEVDAAFANPDSMSSMMLVRATILFALQIYGDFAGYSDMARGISRMMGIELMRNFEHPYFSTNITIFWRRWHISLSSWLRDYLYIPLGGNRGPEWFVYRNLLLTMLLGGLWHGAAWTFVVWGALHGGALALHKYSLKGKRPPMKPPLDSPASIAKAAGGWAFTMALVLLAWIFFRAPDFATAFGVISGIFELRGGLSLGAWALPIGMSAIVLFIDIPQYITKDHTVMLRWHWVLRGLSYAGLILLMVLMRSNQDVPFIYFQF